MKGARKCGRKPGVTSRVRSAVAHRVVPVVDYQELVDEVSELLGAPATLENRDFELIAFGAYDSEGDLDPSALDPVRTRSILTRRSTAAVRAWFESFGITRATGRPPRGPAARGARPAPDGSGGGHGVTARSARCSPTRHSTARPGRGCGRC
ncbi:hypothetical protein SVIOM342S_09751 [Streptomyces violaceorubidus]